MKRCKYYDETREDRFISSHKNICKSCHSISNKNILYTHHFPKPKNYMDYLKEAGMVEYYKNYTRNWS